MTDITTIPTANLRFLTTANSQKVSTSVHDRMRTGNSDMATKTGSSYITVTTTDSVEIPTAIWDFRPWRVRIRCRQVIATMTDNRKLQYRRFLANHAISGSQSLSQSFGFCRAGHHRKSRIWRWNFDAICQSCIDVIIWRPYRYFQLSVLTCRNYFSPIRGLIITQICRWNFNCTFHSFRDKYFRFRPPFPIVGHYWNHLDTLPASLPWSNAVGSSLECWWYMS